MLSLSNTDPAAHAQAVAGFSSFLGWATRYGHNLTEGDGAEISEVLEPDAVFLELSQALSASFNFGYDAGDQSIYIAVEEEEFDWLTMMPIEAVMVGRSAIYVLSLGVDLGEGDTLPSIAVKLVTNQPMLWHAFPNAKDIGFMCIRANDGGYVVEEFHGERFPLRFSN